MVCKNCQVMHEKSSKGECRCSCHTPSNLSSQGYQNYRAAQAREHNKTIARYGYGSSYY